MAEGAFDVRIGLEVPAAERVDALVSDVEVVAHHRQHVPIQEFWWLAGCEVAIHRAERHGVEDPVALPRELSRDRVAVGKHAS